MVFVLFSKNELNSRKKHNKELINKLKSGESLVKFDSYASWFPPRPNITKDSQAMKRVYNSSDDNSSVNGNEKTEIIRSLHSTDT